MFVIAAAEESDRPVDRILGTLRKAGVHARRSYRSTRNVGKLLSEAGRSGAMYAVIIGREFAEGNVVIKDLEGGTQEIVPINEMVSQFQRNAS